MIFLSSEAQLSSFYLRELPAGRVVPIVYWSSSSTESVYLELEERLLEDLLLALALKPHPA